MQIYRLSHDTDGNYRMLICDQAGDALLAADYVFKGESKLGDSREIPVSYMANSYMDPLREVVSGDYPALSGVVPVFTRKAVDVFARTLLVEWEMRLLTSRDGDFVLCKPVRLKNCVDVAKTEVSKYTKRYITKYHAIAFYDSDSIKNDLFMLDEIATEIFVTQRFLDCVRAQGLTGMKFVAVN